MSNESGVGWDLSEVGLRTEGLGAYEDKGRAGRGNWARELVRIAAVWIAELLPLVEWEEEEERFGDEKIAQKLRAYRRIRK